MHVLRPCERGPSRDGPKGVNARLDYNSTTRPERAFVDNERVIVEGKSADDID